MAKRSKKLMEQAIPVIQKIANRSKRRAFAYYTEEDIQSEVWILCLEALGRYKPELGNLEHFLSKHVANRLKNLKRDKYFRPDSEKSRNIKMNLVNAVPMGSNNVLPPNSTIITSKNVSWEPSDILGAEELVDKIRGGLSKGLIKYFDSLLIGEKVSENVIEILRREVTKILEDDNDV